jgi:inner membrane protein
VSPFNWTVFVDDGARYRYSHINLVRKSTLAEPTSESGFISRLSAAYRPLADATWTRADRFGNTKSEIEIAREAFEQPAFRFFRWFAAYPAVLRVDHGNPRECVWFQDLRFVTPGRPSTPFRYGMCREAGESWRPFQLVGEHGVPVY